MAFIRKAKQKVVVKMTPIKMKEVKFNIVGTTPLIMHRFSFKARQELLLPARTKNKAERAETLKHDPLLEYRECFYRCRDEKAPTLFHVPNNMVKNSMAWAALDLAGATKAQIERLVSVLNPTLYFFGVPQIFMSMVRNSDGKPDVRTRPIFRQWALRDMSIRFKADPLTERGIAALLNAAGMITGTGDWRPQKGGDHGTFRIAESNDKELKEIVAKQARKAQLEAYQNPLEFDEDTAELLAWFHEEVQRREQDATSPNAPDEEPAEVAS